ncbi:cytochrome P450 [Agrobacterium rhizogenes]|uniref:Cytochrome P450 n=12 Tax=Rhizobium/Agrobacterium group TaxID=227290 RepID=Q7D2E2_AGRFC|nr:MULTISPECIES: cytochrome P450 [Rhizobium/Agrobacterium group]AYD05061.1 P-450 monooxygenase [Neorhizobium sp. NCHU2750]KJF70790.1 cytochrome P450 [Agrobacterium arsenijevicii]OCJ08413.1 cytochrome [Agrobacterium sp. B131/95]OCJ27199.1 cytochrome [Agrobacterium sp. B133/95]AAC71786.1 P-450 monoxygenase [Agrobacterium fabrum str. C58]
MQLAPVDRVTTIDDLTLDPYPIYRRMRAQTPVVRVASVMRTFLTKASDTKMVKDQPRRFSSDDPNTPMKPAFQAHTLMRKDGAEHARERMAMAKAFAPKTTAEHWAAIYRDIVNEYLDRLSRGSTVDLFAEICGPVAARILAHILGISEASDAEMIRWSQRLIEGAGNFGWRPEPFERANEANAEMNRLFDNLVEKHRAEPNPSAFAIMVTASDPIPMSQIYANIKIAVGGGINEPRDALGTIIYGLLTNPEQFEEVKRQQCWGQVFEEGVRWVAPIQASSRLVLEDTEIRGFLVPKGDTVMTIQASANRDEDVFDDGERFNVFRQNNAHQSFGSGPHHCAGAQISRQTVGAIMLPTLFERFPNMTLTNPDAVQWRGFGFRGPISLPVTLI